MNTNPRMSAAGSYFHRLAAALILSCSLFGTAFSQSPEPLVLVNGKILTLDGNDSIVSSVRIESGRFTSVGDTSAAILEGAQVIDLQGQTVIPGLIDSHMHFIRATLRPGHDMREIESARSISALLTAVSNRAKSVPEGEFITAIGGWDPVQFLGENRFPTLEELDRAAPDHPVYIHLRANGPAVTNTPGREILAAAGIAIDAKGLIGMGNGASQAVGAFNYLKGRQTDVDRERGTLEFMRHANRLGLTTVIDAAGTQRPGAQLFDPDKDYEALLAVWRKPAMTIRVRPMFMSWDREVGDGSGDSEIEQRLRNSFMGFGDDMLKVAGLGEHTTGDSQGEVFEDVTRLAARRGWLLSQHSSTQAENEAHTSAFEAANDLASIASLHWSLTHVFNIEEDVVQRLKAIGAGVTVQDHRYLNRGNVEGGQGGPPYRLLVESGIPTGAGTDSTNAQPMNPWHSIYYMVSGRNVAGYRVNEGQTISRMEALRLYTLGSAWFSHDEEQITSLSSVLTMVGGQIVYSELRDEEQIR